MREKQASWTREQRRRHHRTHSTPVKPCGDATSGSCGCEDRGLMCDCAVRERCMAPSALREIAGRGLAGEGARSRGRCPVRRGGGPSVERWARLLGSSARAARCSASTLERPPAASPGHTFCLYSKPLSLPSVIGRHYLMSQSNHLSQPCQRNSARLCVHSRDSRVCA